jgi:Pin2-interacting protein X1
MIDTRGMVPYRPLTQHRKFSIFSKNFLFIQFLEIQTNKSPSFIHTLFCCSHGFGRAQEVCLSPAIHIASSLTFHSKTKISHDPNNTKWARSTSGFGHRIMSAQGWTPGNRLGAKDAAHAEHLTSASISHIKVTLKDDNLGLGARVGREGQPTGLDAFKGLLGRLNGKSDVELQVEQRKRDDVQLARYVALKFQEVRFVRGGLLTQEKLQRLPETPKEEQANKKTETTSSDENTESATEKSSKSKSKSKSSKKSSKKTRSQSDEADSSSSDKKKKKKSKKRKAEEDDDESEITTKRRASTPEDKPSTQSKPQMPTVPAVTLGERRPIGRQVFRGRHIAQKKRALMDDKSLNEVSSGIRRILTFGHIANCGVWEQIFMVKA